MDILQIIVSIVALLAYVMTAWFAITAWGRLRRMQKDIDGIKHAQAITTSLTMGIHVKSTFAEINDMKRTLKDLVEKEQFEEAERLQDLIVAAEKNVMETIEKLNDTLGDIAEIHVTKINN